MNRRGMGAENFKARLEAFQDHALTQATLRHLVLYSRTAGRIRGTIILAHVAIQAVEYYTRGLRRGIVEPLSPEIFG